MTMRRALMGSVGLIMTTLGVYFIVTGQPQEGGYRYPVEARNEARVFSRKIKDPNARERFLEETTGRVQIDQPLKIFAGGTLCAFGLGLTLVSLRRRGGSPAGALRRVA